MAIVPTIMDELAKEAGSDIRHTFQIFPDYDREIFSDFSAPKICKEMLAVVRVMFAGRITRNKGVFDILTVAGILASREGPEIHFHIHGEGDADEQLRKAVEASPHGHLIHLHGFTTGLNLKSHYAEADIVVVPTRSDFDEGIAKSVVEGVLALRPVVTSRACPSIQLLASACVEAKVDDPQSYADAIWRLATDPNLAEARVKGAYSLRDMFFDPPERYDRQLKRAIELVEG